MTVGKLTTLFVTMALTTAIARADGEGEKGENPAVAGAAADAAADEEGPQNEDPSALIGAGPRNLYQACRASMMTLCKKDLQKFSLKCLQSKKDEITDATCKTWLEEYNTCGADAAVIKCQKEQKKLFRKGPTQNKCLIQIAQADEGASLAAPCRETKYFTSLMQFRNRKNQLAQMKDDRVKELKKRLRERREEVKRLGKKA